MNDPRRLYRSADDRWIAGVAAGVAHYLDVDPILVRILWLISAPLTGFVTAVAYVIMVVAVPLEPSNWPQPSPWQPGGGPVGTGAAFVPPDATVPPPGAAPVGAAPVAQPAPGSGPADASTGAPTQSAPPLGTAPAGPYSAWDARWQRRGERWQRRAERWEARHHDNSGGIVFGILLIVIGGLFAWHEIDRSFDLGAAWPLAVIALGILLVVSSVGWRRGE